MILVQDPTVLKALTDAETVGFRSNAPAGPSRTSTKGCNGRYNADMAKKPLRRRGPQLELAGHLAVAFVNTGGAQSKSRQLGVTSYDELLAWSLQVDLLSAAESEELRRAAAARPAEAEAVFERAVAVGDALGDLFVALHLEKAFPADALATLNQALIDDMPATYLVPGERGLTWGWVGESQALDRMLWPVFHTAGELLISTEGRPEVRQCGLSVCDLFFLDRTAARKRRWCEMTTCGNRAKALRYYRSKGRAKRDQGTWGIGKWRHRRRRPSRQKI